MDANSELQDIQIRHAVYLERLKARAAREMLTILAESEERLNETMGARLASFGDISLRTARKADRERLEKLIEAAAEIRRTAYVEIEESIVDQMIGLAKYEVEFQAGAVESVVPVAINLNAPNAAQIRAALFSRPFAGKLLRDAVRDLRAADRRALDSAIRMGFLEGSSTDDIIRRVRGTRANHFKDGILRTSRNHAEALTRTALNHAANAARDEMWEANADIITGLRWIATLDGRTTAVCRARDGQIFKPKSGPRPPAHWNCRSTMSPILDGVAIVGNRPRVIDTRTRRRREIDFRQEAKAEAGKSWAGMSEKDRRSLIAAKRNAWADEAIGRVPAATTYEDWLRRQGKGFQDEVLGKTKAQLFRDGGAKLTDFVDKSGRELTLQELRAREFSFFKRAGLT